MALALDASRMSPEELQGIIHDYLEGADRAADTDRIAQRLARKHSCGASVIGFRRRGRKVLLHESDTLVTYELDRSGQLLHVGTVWKQRDLEQWVYRHQHYLDWVNPEYQSN